MLPMLAMMLAGYMAKQGHAAPAQDSGNAAGGLGGLLGGLLGGGASAAAGSGSVAGGLGGLGAMLDMNGDGNALDDILRMAGKVMR